MSNELKQLEKAIGNAMKLASKLSAATPDRHTHQQAFGLRLEKRMKELGLTNNMLASMIRDEFNRPVSYHAVHSWKLGKSTPSPANMARLSKALHVKPTALIYGD